MWRLPAGDFQGQAGCPRGDMNLPGAECSVIYDLPMLSEMEHINGFAHAKTVYAAPGAYE